MRFTLDDNAHEAIRFLMLGVGIILGLQLAYWSIDRWVFAPATDDALSRIARDFHDGYLITGQPTLVIGGMGLAGRFALSLLTSFAGAFVMGALGVPLALFIKRPALSVSLVLGRVGLVLIGAWCLYAILFVPSRYLEIGDGGLRSYERPSLFGELSLPWPAQHAAYPFEEITTYRTRSLASSFDGCGSREQVIAQLDEATPVIAQLVPHGPDCDDSVSAARMRTAALAEQLMILFGDPSRVP